MGDQTQTKDPEPKNESRQPEETAKRAPDEPESINNQQVTRERIERVKRAFKSRWLVDQINSQDSKKENNT